MSMIIGRKMSRIIGVDDGGVEDEDDEELDEQVNVQIGRAHV